MLKKFISIFVIAFAFICTFVQNSQAYTESTAPHWKKSPIKVYIPKDDLQTTMQHAFSRWQSQFYGNLEFTFVEKGPADIDVVFAENAKSSSSPISSYKISTKGDEITKAEISFTKKGKNLEKYSNDYIFTMMLQEVGHSLGLQNNTRKQICIMYVPLSENQDITRIDMMNLFKLYGWDWAKRRL